MQVSTQMAGAGQEGPHAVSQPQNSVTLLSRWMTWTTGEGSWTWVKAGGSWLAGCGCWALGPLLHVPGCVWLSKEGSNGRFIIFLLEQFPSTRGPHCREPAGYSRPHNPWLRAGSYPRVQKPRPDSSGVQGRRRKRE